MMDTQLLKQADFTLSRCGRPVAPPGLSAVYITKGFLLQTSFPVASSVLNQVLSKQITGDTTWCLRAISATSSPGTSMLVQVQLPDGRFLENDLQDVLTVAGYGSWRSVLTRERECQPGSKLTVTLLDMNTASVQPIAILFEGAYKYLVRSDARPRDLVKVVSTMPRYVPGANQNILAPCAQWGQGPLTPDWFTDEEHTYSSPLVTQSVTAAVLAQTTAIQVEQWSDFETRRILMNVTADQGTSGTFLVRARASSGYALMDDYIDVAGLLGSTVWAKDWHIRHGDQVFFDLQLVDVAGRGNMYCQIFMEGAKRRAN